MIVPLKRRAQAVDRRAAGEWLFERAARTMMSKGCQRRPCSTDMIHPPTCPMRQLYRMAAGASRSQDMKAPVTLKIVGMDCPNNDVDRRLLAIEQVIYQSRGHAAPPMPAGYNQ
jgi:hypothetical protein